MHIENLYKDQSILLFRECYALEKIHGTSANVHWKDGRVWFSSGASKAERFKSLFDASALTAAFMKLGHPEVAIYGEAYGGGGAAGMGMSIHYGKELKFIAFEVKVGELFLDVLNAADVAGKLGLEFVDFVRVSTDMEALDRERDRDSVQAVRNGMGPGHPREGVVLRPLIEVRKNNGDRIICKHKGAAFEERATPPKVVDPALQQRLADAEKIAFEWVTPMRLEHVLDKFRANGRVVTMRDTKDVITAMVEDVYREAKGEIVESKEAMTAIGKKTAELLRKAIEASTPT